MQGALRRLAIRCEAQGPIDNRLPAALIVANHVSFVDILAINALLDVDFLAKNEIARWPIVGWLTRKTGNLFVQRGNSRAAHDARQAISHRLAQQRRVAVFPEGTTTHGERVLPFHGAIFQSAIDAGRPVVCLALSYHAEDGLPTADAAFAGEDTFLATLWRIASHRFLTVAVCYAGSIDSDGLDRRHLAHRAHQMVARQLQRQREVIKRSS